MREGSADVVIMKTSSVHISAARSLLVSSVDHRRPPAAARQRHHPLQHRCRYRTTPSAGALVNSRTCMGRCWQANERLTLSAPITSPSPPGTLAKYCDDRWSVCLCVCLSASISLELRARSSLNILCMILLYCPRHGPPLVALRYVMYFWFYR